MIQHMYFYSIQCMINIYSKLVHKVSVAATSEGLDACMGYIEIGVVACYAF